MHEEVVDKLNPLREGLISDNQKGLMGLTVEQKKAIETYGYVSVKNLYMPHISITHLAEPDEYVLVKQKLPNEVNSISADTIAISYFAEYGTFPKPLKVYKI